MSSKSPSNLSQKNSYSPSFRRTRNSMRSMSESPTTTKTKIIKYYVCGMNSDESSRQNVEKSLTESMESWIKHYTLSSTTEEYEFKYICFPFWADSIFSYRWGDQLRGVIGACGPFFPKFKKPIKSKRSKKIANFFNRITRRRNPQPTSRKKCENILNIENESMSDAFNELLNEVIKNLKKGYKVELYGFSYGGAVLNILANKIHIIINNMMGCHETDVKNDLKNFKENLMIFAFGSIFVYDIFKTRNVKLYNIMMFGDVALICNGLNPQNIMKKAIKLDEHRSNINITSTSISLPKGIVAYYYYDYFGSAEPMNRVYWIFPEFQDEEKKNKYNNLVENNSWYNRLTRSFDQMFRWELHGLYDPIIYMLMLEKNPNISLIIGDEQVESNNI